MAVSSQDSTMPPPPLLLAHMTSSVSTHCCVSRSHCRIVLSLEPDTALDWLASSAVISPWCPSSVNVSLTMPPSIAVRLGELGAEENTEPPENDGGIRDRSHCLMVWSSAPVKSRASFRWRHLTTPVWPSKLPRHRLRYRSQALTVPSMDEDTSMPLGWLKSRHTTSSVCPSSVLKHVPDSTSSSSESDALPRSDLDALALTLPPSSMSIIASFRSSTICKCYHQTTTAATRARTYWSAAAGCPFPPVSPTFAPVSAVCSAARWSAGWSGRFHSLWTTGRLGLAAAAAAHPSPTARLPFACWFYRSPSLASPFRWWCASVI